MSHTKGDWETKEEADLHIGIYPKDSADSIAVVWNTSEFDAEDNGRLIAAAPDLLTACQQFINDGRAHSSVIEQGITAIAKAVGN